MSTVIPFPDGGFRFIKGVFQYSAGVAAEAGFEIERARFRRPIRLGAGFAAVEAHLKARGRPLTAFCACELRSPAPFSDAGFEAFNREYIKPLERWRLYRDGVNPVARSNVCPDVDPPAEPSFHAFSYTVPRTGSASGTFVLSGSGEARGGTGSTRDRTIRLGDRTAEGMRDKVRFVMGEMEHRLAALGFQWPDATATQTYTVYDIYPLLKDELAAHGAMVAGLTWHWARPPVDCLDYEMDVRGVAREIVL